MPRAKKSQVFKTGSLMQRRLGGYSSTESLDEDGEGGNIIYSEEVFLAQLLLISNLPDNVFTTIS